jgi:hypothetical protein
MTLPDRGLAGRLSLLVYDGSYRAMSLIARWPAVALPAARLLHHGSPVGPLSRLVVEGYPRSANSVAVEAICRAGLPREQVAHHTHAPANLLRGVSMGVPCLLVVRRPSEAVREFVSSKATLSTRAAVHGWIAFHQPLMRSLGRIVVATHPQVTDEMAQVVARLNDRFSSAFQIPDATQIDEARAGVDEQWEGRTGHGVPLLGRGRGSDRPRLGSDETYASDALGPLRRRAEALFERLELAAG